MQLLRSGLKLSKALCSEQGIALLLIRLTLGLIFIQTGWGKLTHLPDTIVFFQSLSIPFPYYNAIMASVTEFIGGGLLILGLCTRVIVIPLAFVMGVAIFTTQFATMPSISDFIRIQEWDYLMFFILLFFSGAGKYSVDHLLSKIFLRVR